MYACGRSGTTSSCAGLVIAALILSSLMMYSGLNHQPGNTRRLLHICSLLDYACPYVNHDIAQQAYTCITNPPRVRTGYLL